jgi:hypothetical protein
MATRFLVFAIGAIGQVNHTHPAASDFAQHAIRTDEVRHRRVGTDGHARCGGGIQQFTGASFERHQRLDVGAQSEVGAAEFIQQRFPPGRLRFQHAGQHGLDLGPTLGRHCSGEPSI